MNRFRAFGLMLVGGAAGAAIALAATPVRAQLYGENPNSTRLVVAGQPYESRDNFGNRIPPQPYRSGNWQFISDTKSGGCWLLINNTGSTNASVLAPAPTTACQQ